MPCKIISTWIYSNPQMQFVLVTRKMLFTWILHDPQIHNVRLCLKIVVKLNPHSILYICGLHGSFRDSLWLFVQYVPL